MSSIIDYTDRATCVLFGDGAGAVVLGPSDDPDVGILDFEHQVDGSGGAALCMPAGGSLRPASHETVDQRLHFVKQDGQTVFKFAVRNTGEICERLLQRNDVTAADLDLFVSHQANRRIIMSAAERIGMPEEKVIINIDRFGNTTAATIPLALNDAVDDRPAEEGRPHPAGLGRRRLHRRLGPRPLGFLDPSTPSKRPVHRLTILSGQRSSCPDSDHPRLRILPGSADLKPSKQRAYILVPSWNMPDWLVSG